jgi:hypothetical protein
MPLKNWGQVSSINCNERRCEPCGGLLHCGIHPIQPCLLQPRYPGLKRPAVEWRYRWSEDRPFSRLTEIVVSFPGCKGDKIVKLISQLHIFVYNVYGMYIESRDSTVGIATGYGLDDQGVEVRVPEGARIFTFPCRQIGSGAHPASYPMGNGGSFPGGEAAGAWSWPLTSN